MFKRKTILGIICCFLISAMLLEVLLVIPVSAGKLRDKCDFYKLDKSLVKEEDLDKDVYPVIITPYPPSFYSQFSEITFSDVPEDHWAKDYIYACTFKVFNSINGYDDGTFRPENKVTVGEFLKLIASVRFNVKDMREQEPGEHWARKYVDCWDKWILRSEDYPDDFLDEYITREHAVKLMTHCYVFNNYGDDDKSDIPDGDEYLSNFSDSAEISEKRKPFINAALAYGLIDGFEDGTFRPQSTLTRAQAAKLIYELYGKSRNPRMFVYQSFEITTVDGTTYKWKNRDEPYES